jgi:hypothetical protein
MQILEKDSKLVDGHYQILMLWRETQENLPDNGPQARRYDTLVRMFGKDAQYKQPNNERLHRKRVRSSNDNRRNRKDHAKNIVLASFRRNQRE